MTARSPLVVLLVLLIFFVISLLTNVSGPLLPDIIGSFKLSLALAGFLPSSFFLAYLLSIPAGLLIERYGEKPVLVASFVLAFLGSFLFVLRPAYAVALFSLFTIGVGMAMLQVAINPLLRVAGGEEHFAFFNVLAQLIFGAASFASPYLYSYLVLNLAHPPPVPNALVRALVRVVPASLPWISLYWVFTAVTLAMIVVLACVRLPRVERLADEKAGSLGSHLALLRNPCVHLFFLGIVCYVGTEQGLSNWMSEFLHRYHGLDPEVAGARAVARFWGFMTIGCAVGLVLLRLWDSRLLLVGSGVLCAITLAVALYGPADVSAIAFPLTGLWASVMWGIIFALALNSVESHHGSFSGILCTGIVGGAILPPLIGKLGDLFGLRAGMLVLFLTLAYVAGVGLWARPLVTNATVGGGGGSSRRDAAAG
ncbi:MAG TPA: MFS transporter [Vicinamibacteria bacterium]|nr:MFS transporter [Vicinamibacteria bacterium]